jgi:hypothetical protein
MKAKKQADNRLEESLREWLAHYEADIAHAKSRIKNIKTKLLAIELQADDPPDKIVKGKPWWNVGGFREGKDG